MRDTAEPRSNSPLHIEIANRLREEIAGGEFSGLEKLPPEAELALRLGVSRNTIREALSVLQREGILARKHGLGTFVAKRLSVGYGKARTKGFAETMEELGRKPGTSYFSFDWEPADLSIADTLRIPVGSVLGVLKRLRTADDQPTMFALDKLPVDIVGQDFRPEIMGESLFAFLFEHRGVAIERSEISVRATVPNHVIAGMLRMEPNLPLLLVEETFYNADNRPVGWSANYYRSDVYTFRTSR